MLVPVSLAAPRKVASAPDIDKEIAWHATLMATMLRVPVVKIGSAIAAREVLSLAHAVLL